MGLRLATRMMGAAAVALLAAQAPAAGAVTLQKSRGPLATRLAILARPDVRSASSAARARSLSLPASGPGSLEQSGGDVIVDVRAATTAQAQLRALRDAGARILGVAAAYRRVTVAIAPSNLTLLAKLRGVQSVQADLAPMRSGLGGTSALTCPAGTVTSEADAQMQAAAARAANGVSGAGVRVGVISDSFNRAATAATRAPDDVASGDLPGACPGTTAVDVVHEEAGAGEDEGRAMLQTVHDLAPGASLAFATAFPSLTNFLTAVPDLRAAGAKVIADDITFFDEPYFQDGPASVAAADAVAHGVAYFSSAANNNFIQSGADRASYEAPAFRPTSCPATTPAIAPIESRCMNFGVGPRANEQPFVVAPDGELELDLQWAEPWNGVRTDLDAFLVDDSNALQASDTDINTNTQEPFGFLHFANAGATNKRVWLVIGNASGTTGPRLKWTMVQPSGSGVVTAPTGAAAGDVIGGATIFGHNGLATGMSVAAVPFGNSHLIETYSSRGPVTHYFGPVTGASAAPRLPRPQVLAKPDVAATDCAQTTFFVPPADSNGHFHFCGTSEAAPQAAAVAALEMQANRAATAEQVMNVQKATATRLAVFSSLAQGAGLVNALAATNAIRRVERAPTALTGAASAITTSTARVTGSVNPQAFSTAYRFQYGTTTAYGAVTPTVSAGFGLAPVAAAGALGGLAPGTTYHYRLVALHNGRTAAAGADQTLRTVAAPRPVIRIGVARRQHLSGQAVVLRLTCSHACRGRVTARLKIKGRRATIRLRAVRVSLRAGQTKRVKVRLSRSAVAAVRKALRRHKRVTVRVSARVKSGTTVKTLRRTTVIIR